MDSAALLDLLGNENRRRILRLLSRKPCYVTEISEYIGVSPKAVIDHLRRLEDAGLVESHTDEQRRKYFYIARNLRLEVSVSRYGFGTKSAYPASANLDMTACRHLSIDVANPSSGSGLGELARELRKLNELENELSLAQRWVQGRIIEAHDRIADAIGDDADSRLYAAILTELDGDIAEVEDIATDLDVHPEYVHEALQILADRGIVSRVGEGWILE